MWMINECGDPEERARLFMKTSNKNLASAVIVLAFLISLLSFWGGTNVAAQEEPAILDLVRVLEADQTGVDHPIGLVFSEQRGTFLTVEAGQWQPASAALDLVELAVAEERAGSARIAAALEDPINMAFDNQANRLLILDMQGNRLLEVSADQAGQLDPKTLKHYTLDLSALSNPQGVTVDPASGDLLILDGDEASIVRLSGSLDSPTVSVVDLDIPSPRGLAVDPSTGYLNVAAQTEQKLYELSPDGNVLAWRDLSPFGLSDIQGMVFAPSGDQTYDPAEMSL
jgi:DNA-binding beta-propeller fold protein YncE